MSWRGTLLLLALAIGVTGIFLYSLFSRASRTRSTSEFLIDIDPAQAKEIIIRENSGSVILKKRNGVWMIDSAPPERANPAIIRAMLQCASGIKPIDTLRPAELKGSVSLETLDLKNPRRSLTLEADTSQTINFGVEGASSARLYARMGSGGPVYLIPSEIIGLAFRPAADFRDQRLSMLSADHLEEITFSKGNSLQQLVLKKNREGWNLVSPLAAQGDQKAISAWANTLLSAKIDYWMPAGTDPASCGLDSPSGVFTTREEGGASPVTITIGAEVQGSPLGNSTSPNLPNPPNTISRYARCSDRPDICVITGIGSFLEVTPLALRSKKLPHVEYDAVDRMEIRPSGCFATTLLLSRKSGSEDWELSNGGVGTDKKTLPGAQVKGWFEKVQEITGQGFETATPDHLQSRGLAAPSAPTPATATTIRLIAHLSENTAEEKAGDIVLAEYAFGTPSNGIVALRVGNSPDLMLVPESVLELSKGPQALP